MRLSRSLALVAALALAMSGCKQSNDASRSTAPQAQTSEANTEQQQPGANDDQLTTQVLAKFYRTPAVKDANVTVTTAERVVRLNGTVPNEQSRREAVNAAQSVPGVEHVEDRLTIASAAPSGTAATSGAADKQPAGSHGTEAETRSRGIDDQLRDGWITVKVQSQYFTDPNVKGRQIDVDSANGIVTLTGLVDSEAARDRAVAIAEQTKGVKRVEDRLQVASADTPAATSGRTSDVPAGGGATDSSAAHPSDDEISTRIESKFFSHDALRPSAIDVSTRQGVVTLTGTVASNAQRQEAVAVAASTNGVQQVDDRLEVQPPPHSVGTVGSLPAPARQPTAGPPDDLVTASIQAKYFRARALKTSDITVTTRGGVVTLSGIVEGAAARRQAVELARNTPGVQNVVDNLAVKSPGSLP